MTKEYLVHGTVILEGSKMGITEFKRDAAAQFTCRHYRENALLVQDVIDDELLDLHRAAESYGLRVSQVRDERTIRVAEEEDAADKKSSVKLDLLQGNWYKTDKGDFPLIHVLHARNELTDTGEELWLFDVDFVSADRLPMQVTIDAEQLKEYNPKPASLADFEDLDIAPPTGFDPDPHAIPSVEDDQPKEASVRTGVALPKAHLSSLILADIMGARLRESHIETAQDGGFYIKARLLRGTQGPEEIEGTPVKYYRRSRR